MPVSRLLRLGALGLAVLLGCVRPAAADGVKVFRSAASGPWSVGATWEGKEVPAAGSRVLIRPGHVVAFDAQMKDAIHSLHIAGTLTFARDRDTLLKVGLVRIDPSEEVSEEGFDCDAHLPEEGKQPRPALEVGTAEAPIPAGRTARIQLVYFDGMKAESLPAIVCCAGRMDFHGAPLSHTWVKLGGPVKAGETSVTLAEAVTGWRVGDRVIVVATTRQNKVKKTFKPSVKDSTQTEERLIREIDGQKITLDRPLEFDHRVMGDFRGEVANLSRNVIVESADPEKARGHTMYHRGSAGSISYAEFRHLGKEGVLGRYSLHYHLCGDSMRGSYVQGASFWDSGNRWLTIHGTNYLVVRDCVGYRSVGHGFFLEDGTEVYNVLDRNLAVQALIGKPLPKQALPFDKNDGSGFWWANSLNTFTRNCAAECDEYGYFFQAPKTADFDPVLSVRQPDGSQKKLDVRTLPFVRCDDNEAHTQRRHSFNLGGGVPFGPPNVDGVGPDSRHPFVIRNLRLWDVHWGIHPVSPSVLLDRLAIHDAEYGVWRPEYKGHVYRELAFTDVPDKTRYGFVSGPPDANNKLDPVDDLPPCTVITHVIPAGEGRSKVRGWTSDNGVVKRVLVNGSEARLLAGEHGEWEAIIPTPAAGTVTASAEDARGNKEATPHVVRIAKK
jgi:hypothetical protein